jgi:hypothetical protein
LIFSAGSLGAGSGAESHDRLVAGATSLEAVVVDTVNLSCVSEMNCLILGLSYLKQNSGVAQMFYRYISSD